MKQLSNGIEYVEERKIEREDREIPNRMIDPYEAEESKGEID